MIVLKSQGFSNWCTVFWFGKNYHAVALVIEKPCLANLFSEVFKYRCCISNFKGEVIPYPYTVITWHGHVAMSSQECKMISEPSLLTNWLAVLSTSFPNSRTQTRQNPATRLRLSLKDGSCNHSRFRSVTVIFCGFLSLHSGGCF